MTIKHIKYKLKQYNVILTWRHERKIVIFHSWVKCHLNGYSVILVLKRKFMVSPKPYIVSLHFNF